MNAPPSGAAPAGAARIEAAFAGADDDGRAALMPYMMGGFPDPESSARIASAYADGGADLIELGVPFSDPLADGPVIHAAATEALEAGADFEAVLEVCRSVADRVPVVLMAYSNMVLGGAGPDDFARRAVAAGASGVIVPDLPFGEDEAVRVEAFPTRHSVPSVGFALIEEPRPGAFDVETARSLGVPEGPSFGVLQRGGEVDLADGGRVRAEQVTGP
ncbi:MAG: tryptophan synthase subunit alpha, partial [Acidobacteriota bacterium]